jgi:hypothetical protein
MAGIGEVFDDSSLAQIAVFEQVEAVRGYNPLQNFSH